MTKEAIHLCLKRKELRNNPKEVKDSLYLNNRGFSEIRNLEPFTEVRVLHLESNKLTRIHNLEALKRLHTLYLQNNKIGKYLSSFINGELNPFSRKLLSPLCRFYEANIEKLHKCKELKFLDISKNDISRINNLSSVKKLETLIITQNNLTKVDSIEHLPLIPRLRELDLGSNKIDCPPDGILKILSNCKSLRVLTLAKNPFVKKIPHYRKMVLITCPELKCLDGRVVCKEERRRCKAWGKVILNGGTFAEAQDADREELMKIRRETSIKNNMKRSGRLEEYYPPREDSVSFIHFRTNLQFLTVNVVSIIYSLCIGLVSSSIIDNLMKTLGINETRRSISMISWTHTRCVSTRNMIFHKICNV